MKIEKTLQSPRSAGGAHTLPGRYYTSPEIFRLESEKIFGKRWLSAGLSAQLPESGSYFVANVEGESLIVLRDTDGRARGFYNVCRHRGTRLCATSAGRLNKSIRCPYHGWSYSLAGELIGTPNLRESAHFKRADFPLKTVAIQEWEGMLWINLDSTARPFAEAFAPLLKKFAAWHPAELQPVHEQIYEVRANWKLILQNYSECYHCPTLHPLLNKLTPYRNSENDLLEGPFLGGPMHLARTEGSMTMSGRRCAAPLPGLSGSALGSVYYYVIFPNTLLSLHPDYVLIHRLQRMAVDHTRISCQWLFHPAAISQPDFDPAGAIEFWNMTNLQDWQVCELSQLGVASRAYTPGPYADLESMIAALDREYLRALES